MHAWTRAAAALTMAAGMLAAQAAADDAPQVVLQLVAPERFADVGYSQRQPTDAELQALRQALQAALQPLVRRSLQPGDRLSLEVLDIDLAGELQPTRQGRELRVMRGATWPRLSLRYTLQRAGSVVAQGEQRLSDMAYLEHRPAGGDAPRYAHEAAMLRDWFQRTLGAGAPPL